MKKIYTVQLMLNESLSTVSYSTLLNQRWPLRAKIWYSSQYVVNITKMLPKHNWCGRGCICTQPLYSPVWQFDLNEVEMNSEYIQWLVFWTKHLSDFMNRQFAVNEPIISADSYCTISSFMCSTWMNQLSHIICERCWINSKLKSGRLENIYSN